jgi:hypothetical protein
MSRFGWLLIRLSADCSKLAFCSQGAAKGCIEHPRQGSGSSRLPVADNSIESVLQLRQRQVLPFLKPGKFR